jgi:hypothetical protein
MTEGSRFGPIGGKLSRVEAFLSIEWIDFWHASCEQLLDGS